MRSRIIENLPDATFSWIFFSTSSSSSACLSRDRLLLLIRNMPTATRTNTIKKAAPPTEPAMITVSGIPPLEYRTYPGKKIRFPCVTYKKNDKHNTSEIPKHVSYPYLFKENEIEWFWGIDGYEEIAGLSWMELTQRRSETVMLKLLPSFDLRSWMSMPL